MSGWVCSARKFVVSSFVSFAEELENAVLVLTDAEKAREHGQNVHRSGLVEHNDSMEATSALTDVRFRPAEFSQVNTFDVETSVASAEVSALTTQPESFAPILSATSSMTSLPLVSSSHDSTSLLQSASTSHSLPDIANSSKIFQLSSSSPNRKSSKSSCIPLEASRQTHVDNPHVHRYRKPHHSSCSPTKETDSDPLSDKHLLQTGPTNSNSTVVIGSKRPKEMSIFNLKRPGKVIRTSSSKARLTEAQNTQPDASSEGVVHASNGWSEMDPHQNLPTLTPVLSIPRTPEDLSIPNRNVQAHCDDFPMELIPRVSLVDKLSHILHSTLVTISNMLRLENEEMTTIYRNARSLHAPGEESDHGNVHAGQAFDDHLETSMNGNDYIEIIADGNLNVSRINSLVSLESFEILSKDDDNNILPFQSTAEPNHSSLLSQQSDDEALPDECPNQHGGHSFSKDREYSDTPMEASIEFIHFEVSDLITKRYFDSKTQRLMTFPSDDIALQRLDQPESQESVSSEGVTVRQRGEETEDSKKATVETSPGEDDDGSSVSFDIISEDSCHEAFNIL